MASPYFIIEGEPTRAEIADALAAATGVPSGRWCIYEPSLGEAPDDADGMRLAILKRRPGGTFAAEIDLPHHPDDDPYLDLVRRVAAASGRACLADDGSVVPDCYLLVEPDGAVRPVEIDSELADESDVMSLARGSVR